MTLYHDLEITYIFVHLFPSFSPVFELDESLYDADGDGIIDVDDENII